MAARVEFALLAFVIFTSGAVSMTLNSELAGLHHVDVLKKLHNSKTVDGHCEYVGQLLPDNIDCAVFYICWGTPLAPVANRCETGYYFNPNINECDPDFVCTTGCNDTSQRIPDPENCASFYICSPSLEAVLVPCGEGQFYDIDKQNCADAETVDCSCRPGCLSVGDYIPNCYDCQSFYICDNVLIPVNLPCPEGQYFDPNTNRCIVAAACPAIVNA